MAPDPATTAVVLIEYQNELTSDGGALHGAVAEVMDKTNMLANTGQVVEAARAAGATIMHAPITFAAGYNELSKQHENAISYDYPMFSKPMTAAEAVAEFS